MSCSDMGLGLRGLDMCMSPPLLAPDLAFGREEWGGGSLRVLWMGAGVDTGPYWSKFLTCHPVGRGKVSCWAGAGGSWGDVSFPFC